jgi:hypothetical protein
MRPALTTEMARVIVEERIEAAERYRLAKEARRAAAGSRDAYDCVIVRLAGETDSGALRRLAERDGRSAPRGPLLVAEVDGRLLAARSLADGKAIADPFVHSAHLAELLALRSAHLRGAASASPPASSPPRRLAKRLALGFFHS